jgi:hypothetical protein
MHDWLIPKEWEGKKREEADAALYACIEKKGFRTFQAELTALAPMAYSTAGTSRRGQTGH